MRTRSRVTEQSRRLGEDIAEQDVGAMDVLERALQSRDQGSRSTRRLHTSSAGIADMYRQVWLSTPKYDDSDVRGSAYWRAGISEPSAAMCLDADNDDDS